MTSKRLRQILIDRSFDEAESDLFIAKLGMRDKLEALNFAVAVIDRCDYCFDGKHRLFEECSGCIDKIVNVCLESGDPVLCAFATVATIMSDSNDIIDPIVNVQGK